MDFMIGRSIPVLRFKTKLHEKKEKKKKRKKKINDENCSLQLPYIFLARF